MIQTSGSNQFSNTNLQAADVPDAWSPTYRLY